MAIRRVKPAGIIRSSSVEIRYRRKCPACSSAWLPQEAQRRHRQHDMSPWTHDPVDLGDELGRVFDVLDHIEGSDGRHGAGWEGHIFERRRERPSNSPALGVFGSLVARLDSDDVEPLLLKEERDRPVARSDLRHRPRQTLGGHRRGDQPVATGKPRADILDAVEVSPRRRRVGQSDRLRSRRNPPELRQLIDQRGFGRHTSLGSLEIGSGATVPVSSVNAFTASMTRAWSVSVRSGNSGSRTSRSLVYLVTGQAVWSAPSR